MSYEQTTTPNGYFHSFYQEFDQCLDIVQKRLMDISGIKEEPSSFDTKRIRFRVDNTADVLKYEYNNILSDKSYILSMKLAKNEQEGSHYSLIVTNEIKGIMQVDNSPLNTDGKTVVFADISKEGIIQDAVRLMQEEKDTIAPFFVQKIEDKGYAVMDARFPVVDGTLGKEQGISFFQQEHNAKEYCSLQNDLYQLSKEGHSMDAVDVAGFIHKAVKDTNKDTVFSLSLELYKNANSLCVVAPNSLPQYAVDAYFEQKHGRLPEFKGFDSYFDVQEMIYSIDERIVQAKESHYLNLEFEYRHSCSFSDYSDYRAWDACGRDGADEKYNDVMDKILQDKALVEEVLASEDYKECLDIEKEFFCFLKVTEQLAVDTIKAPSVRKNESEFSRLARIRVSDYKGDYGIRDGSKVLDKTLEFWKKSGDELIQKIQFSESDRVKLDFCVKNHENHQKEKHGKHQDRHKAKEPVIEEKMKPTKTKEIEH